MKKIVSLTVLFVAFFVSTAHAEIITFEGVAPDGLSANDPAPYIEGNFTLTVNTNQNAIFSVTSSENNGGFTSDFFGCSSVSSVDIDENGGNPFDLVSIELGRFDAVTPSDYILTGSLNGGGTIVENYSNIFSSCFLNFVIWTCLFCFCAKTTRGTPRVSDFDFGKIV